MGSLEQELSLIIFECVNKITVSVPLWTLGTSLTVKQVIKANFTFAV